MSGAKLEVIWAPVHHDKFIIWGSDITLYQVSRLKDIEKKTACKCYFYIIQYFCDDIEGYKVKCPTFFGL